MPGHRSPLHKLSTFFVARLQVKIQGIVIADEATAANEFSSLMPQIIPSDLMGASKLEEDDKT